MALKSYKDLVVWQTSRQLVRDIYELCAKLPQNEIYGLSSQLKRASISIPSNIAEGYRRNNRKEYVQFLGIASGSAAEVETQLILVEDIFKISVVKELDKVNQIQRMLAVLIEKTRP